MNLEIGKKYKMRGGGVVKIVYYWPKLVNPFVGIRTYDSNYMCDDVYSFAPNGKFNPYQEGESMLDLVSEFVDAVEIAGANFEFTHFDNGGDQKHAFIIHGDNEQMKQLDKFDGKQIKLKIEVI